MDETHLRAALRSITIPGSGLPDFPIDKPNTDSIEQRITAVTGASFRVQGEWCYDISCSLGW